MRRYSIEPRTRTASEKVVHKADEFIRNKIADAVTKSSQEPVEEIIIPPGKRDEILNKLRKVLQKCNTIKYLSH